MPPSTFRKEIKMWSSYYGFVSEVAQAMQKNVLILDNIIGALILLFLFYVLPLYITMLIGSIVLESITLTLFDYSIFGS